MSLASDDRLGLVLDSLLARTRLDRDEAVHLRAFVEWMQASHGASSEMLALEAAGTAGPARNYRHVAALGYSAGAGVSEPTVLDALNDGLSWLSGRNYFLPNRPLALEADGIGLLGVALGALACSASAREEAIEWLRGLIPMSIAAATDSWDRAVMTAAALVLGLDPTGTGTDLPSDLRSALAAKGLATPPSEEGEERALSTILSLDHLDDGAARAATQLTALKWLVRTAPTIRPGRATIPSVIDLLEGVQRSLRRWPWEEHARTRGGEAVRWPINNEYHVQDLLWIVLAPVFPDLEDEENLPSLGPKHPRADLGIPSLKLIVEAKYIRKGTQREFSEIVEQVAADAGLYLTEPDRYNQIIAFVWDNSRQTEQHSELRQGLLALSGIVGAVVIPRPGKME
jgi:hypothetical protein